MKGRHIFNIICGVACLCCPVHLWSQTQTIRGEVTDARGGYTLIGATVSIIGTDPLVGAVTDVDGKYRIENVPVGRVAIAAQYVGYKPRSVSNILVVTGKESIVDIALTESVESLKEIVVRGDADKRLPLNDLALNSARTFSLEEVTRFAGGRNDVARLASSFAGVSGINDQRNDIVVRGNSPYTMLWRVEGIPIATTNHFATLGATGGAVNALNTNLLRNSDFITGAFPAEYGNANGSVFDISYRKGNSEKYEFTGQIGITGLELMAEGPMLKKHQGSFVVSYRYGIAAWVTRGTTAIPYYHDLGFKVNFGKYKFGEFEIFALGGLSNIDFLGQKLQKADLFASTNEDAFVKNQLGLIGLSHLIQLPGHAFLKTTIAVSTNYNEYLQDNFIYGGSDNLDVVSKYRSINVRNRENRVTLSSVFNKKINARWNVRAGLLSEFYPVDFFTESRDDIPNIPDVNSDGIPDYFITASDLQDTYNITQLYGQAMYSLSDDVVFTGGVHMQYHTFTDRFAVEPRLALSWDVATNHRLSLAYGMHAQSIPSPILFHKARLNDGTSIYTNNKLDYMRSHHIVLGYNFNFGGDWRIKLEPYYQALYDVPIERKSSSYSILNQGANFTFAVRDSLYNRGTGTNYGIELTVEKFLSNGYYGLLTASLYRSLYRGSDNVERSTAYDNVIVSNLLLGKEFLFGKNKQNAIMIDSKLVLSGGRPYTPINLDETRLSAGEEIYFDNNAYSQKLDTYFRWDLKLGARVSFKKMKISQEFFVELQNVTDHINQMGYRYNEVSKEIDEISQLGMYWVFLYRIRF